MVHLIVINIDSIELFAFFYWLVLGDGFAMSMAAVMLGMFEIWLMIEKRPEHENQKRNR